MGNLVKRDASEEEGDPRQIADPRQIRPGRAHFITDNKGLIEDSYTMDKKHIGEGACGTVYKAENKATGKVRAVKSLVKDHVKDPDHLYEEIRIMKQMDHPHIIKLYETFQDHRNIYLVMEFCAGGELFERIVNDGCLTEGQTAIVMQQIFRVVHYMHRQHFTHRDLKPENFLFNSMEPIEVACLKLIDFGFSHKITPGEKLHTKVGTPYYIAPEVLRKNYDELADIWSCGVIMYILLCGYPPFMGVSDAVTLQTVKMGKFSFPSEDWEDVSSDAKDLITECLKMKVQERCTAEAALDHIWITDQAPHASALRVRSGIVDRLKDFRGHNNLKKAALQIIASEFSDHQIKLLRDSFLAMDENKDGTLTLTELRNGLKESGITEIPPDLKQIMEDVDGDGSGKIDYTEFLAATIDKKMYEREEVVWSAFRNFDLDGDGKITKTELQRVLQDGLLDDVVGLQKVADVMGEVDVNGDGEIDFQEFMQMMVGPKLECSGDA